MSADNLMPRRSAGYAGRDRLDGSSRPFRAAVAGLAREAAKDPNLTAELEAIVAEACSAMDNLRSRAERAAAMSARNQTRLRRQVDALDRQAQQLPAGSPERASAERDQVRLRSLLQPGVTP